MSGEYFGELFSDKVVCMVGLGWRGCCGEDACFSGGDIWSCSCAIASLDLFCSKERGNVLDAEHTFRSDTTSA